MRTHPRTRALLAAWLAGLAASTAAGQSADASARPLPAIIADLGSTDFATREAATSELIDSEASLAEIERALADPALTPEQRARLSLAGRTRFSNSPRGAMGVGFGLPGTSPLSISRLYDGFPSKGVLREGDELIAVEGEDVRGLAATAGFGLECIRPYIICHDPGAVVKMTVIRAGEEITLDVPLGSFGDLLRVGGNTRDQLALADLSAAWKLRVARRHGLGAAPIVAPPLPPLPESAVSSLDQDLEAKLKSLDGAASGAVAGGANRESTIGGPIDAALLDLSRAGPDVRLLTEQIKRQTTLLTRIDQQVRDLGVALSRGDLGEGVRRAALQQRQILIEQRNAVRNQVEILTIQLESIRQLRGGNPPILRP